MPRPAQPCEHRADKLLSALHIGRSGGDDGVDLAGDDAEHDQHRGDDHHDADQAGQPVGHLDGADAQAGDAVKAGTRQS
jgi:hypothetical protein